MVAELACKGHAVFAGVRASGGPAAAQFSGEIREVELELKDAAGMQRALREVRPELAIHLAWCTQPGEYWTTPENLEYVEASLRLAHGLHEAGCGRLVCAGSCAEYDWSHEFLCEDTTPLRPDTVYGTCKDALRMVLEEYCRGQSMQFAWMRFFHLYGPGEKEERLVPSTVLALLRGATARCGNAEAIRDFLHVEDAARAVAAVSLSEFSGAINIGSGEATKIRTVVETIAEILDARERVTFSAAPRRHKEPAVLLADVRKLAGIAGWRGPRELRRGLRETVGWWQSRIAERGEEERSEDYLRRAAPGASRQVQR